MNNLKYLALVLAFECCLFHSAFSQYSISVSDGGLLGAWNTTQYCKEGTYVTGIKNRLEPFNNASGADNAALQSVEFNCLNGPAISCVNGGTRGSWDASFTSCPNTDKTVGIKLKVQKPCGNCDDTSLNNVQLNCQNQNEIIKGSEGPAGSWTPVSSCKSTEHICGLQCLVEQERGPKIDDTGMNNVKVICCPDYTLTNWNGYKGENCDFPGNDVSSGPKNNIDDCLAQCVNMFNTDGGCTHVTYFGTDCLYKKLPLGQTLNIFHVMLNKKGTPSLCGAIDRLQLRNLVPSILINKYAPIFYLHTAETFFPSSVEHFLLNVDINQERMTTKNTLDIENVLSNNEFLAGQMSSTVPIYVFVADKSLTVTDVYYYVFFPFTAGKDGYGQHVGGWEHVTIRFDSGVPINITTGVDGRSETVPFGDSLLEKESDQPVIYFSQGTHGTYTNQMAITGTLDSTNKGLKINSKDNLKIHRLNKQKECCFAENGDLISNSAKVTPLNSNPIPWYLYKGKWGNREDGIPLTNDYPLNSGPSGPLSEGLIYLLNQTPE